MKNQRQYSLDGKISQMSMRSQNIEELIASFKKTFPGVIKWHSAMATKLESDK